MTPMTPMLRRRTLLSWGLSSFALTAATAATGGRATAAPSPAQAYGAYVMGYFTESPDMLGAAYALHLAVSEDGLHWTPLNQNQPVATPTEGTGGLRDPFVLRRQDGGFVVLATDLLGTDFTQPNQYIHAWDSADLTAFTGYRRLRMHDMDTHTWAPEAFWDEGRGEYGIVYSANSGGRDGFWVNYTTDFVTVGEPQLFFDPGFNVLDATMHLGADGTNYLYYKSFSDGLLYGARADGLDPRAFDDGTYTDGVIQGSGIEAPIVVRANDREEWFLWGDSFSPVNGELYAWSSGDIGAGGGWTPLSKAEFTQPLNAKHPTIAPLTAAEHAALLQAWGAPEWNRLKSFNHPDRLVRHADLAARIDPYPFDPYADGQWRLVAGLAAAEGISFRSVNFPSSYLRRQADGAVALAEDDGTTA